MMLDRGEILKALRSFKRGDFSARMPLNLTGIDGEIAQTFNDVVELEEAKAAEIARVADLVGKEGQTASRMSVPGASGAWLEVIESINTLINDLSYPMTEVARVIGSVAKGDLARTMVLEAGGRPLRGEALRLGTVVNTMVGQLNAFASEVSRVARRGGHRGKLGGQAQVAGVAGVWKDLTDNVNSMAANLTGQVLRNIADVTTAVARGDLSKKITVEVKGEILELKNTVNTMVDQLNAFASEVSRVARESTRKESWAARRRCAAWARVEGPHRQRELHGRRPHRPGAVHEGHHRSGEGGDLSKKITVGSEGRDSRAEKHDQHDGRSAQRLRRRGVAGGQGSGNRPRSSAGRRGSPASAASGRTSPTT